jgi:hypothetical protein
MVPVQIIFVPMPIAAGGWLDRSIGSPHKRESKTNPRWPLDQQIPSPEARRSLDAVKRDIAQRRAIIRETARAGL